jgi:hypothetical protein
MDRPDPHRYNLSDVYLWLIAADAATWAAIHRPTRWPIHWIPIDEPTHPLREDWPVPHLVAPCPHDENGPRPGPGYVYFAQARYLARPLRKEAPAGDAWFEGPAERISRALEEDVERFAARAAAAFGARGLESDDVARALVLDGLPRERREKLRKSREFLARRLETTGRLVRLHEIPPDPEPVERLTDAERTIWEELSRGAATAQEISRKTSISLDTVKDCLKTDRRLRKCGMVEHRRGTGYFRSDLSAS